MKRMSRITAAILSLLLLAALGLSALNNACSGENNTSETEQRG